MEMNVVICENGHYFDLNKFSECPHCGANERSSSVKSSDDKGKKDRKEKKLQKKQEKLQEKQEKLQEKQEKKDKKNKKQADVEPDSEIKASENVSRGNERAENDNRNMMNPNSNDFLRDDVLVSTNSIRKQIQNVSNTSSGKTEGYFFSRSAGNMPSFETVPSQEDNLIQQNNADDIMDQLNSDREYQANTAYYAEVKKTESQIRNADVTQVNAYISSSNEQKQAVCSQPDKTEQTVFTAADAGSAQQNTVKPDDSVSNESEEAAPAEENDEFSFFFGMQPETDTDNTPESAQQTSEDDEKPVPTEAAFMKAPEQVSYANDETSVSSSIETGAVSVPQKQRASDEPCVGWLVAVKGPHYGESFELYSGKNSIGRSAANTVCLFRDANVANEKHAKITYEPLHQSFILQPGDERFPDINGQQVLAPVAMKCADVISLGDTVLYFVNLCGNNFDWKQYMK